MKFIPAVALATVALLLTGSAAVSVHHEWAKHRLKVGHGQQMRQISATWAARKAQLRAASQKAALDAKLRHMEEFETALGGPVGAALRNPNLDIAAMLEQVSQRCSPAGSRVKVRVERFTEFTVSIQLPRPLEVESLADISRCALGACGEFIEALEFSANGVVLARIDRREIEAGQPWSEITRERAATLIAAQLVERPPTAVAGATADLPQNMTEEDKREEAALRALRAGLTAAQDDLRSALKMHDDAMRLTDVSRREDIASKRLLLAQAEQLARSTQPWLINPGAAHKQLLDAAKVDAVFIAATMRYQAQRFQNSIGPARAVFDRFNESIAAARAYLDAMEATFGEWRFDSTGERVSFDSPAASTAYQTSTARVRAAVDALGAALMAWQNSLPQE